jgi:hypothetical protein
MSPLWLILIVPVVFLSGYVLGGFFTLGDQEDRCRACCRRRIEEVEKKNEENKNPID